MDVASLIQEKVKDAVKSIYDIDLSDVHVEHPEDMKWGDYSTNVALLLSKSLKQPPLEIAKNISYELDKNKTPFEVDNHKINIFEKIKTAPPGFINFKLSVEWLHYVLYMILGSANNYGVGDVGCSKSVLVEYSQPNPNKPMHIGHARNNFLGSSISSLLEASGYKVVKANYINDWGTHICKSMLMYQKYGEGRNPDKKSDHFVGEFYIRYEKEAENNPKLADELAEMFRKLESGDRETLELWEKIVNWAYEGWKETYSEQNVTFDVWMYQHNYKDSGKEVVSIALNQGIAEKDETGAVIARLEKFGIPDKVLLRADGTSIYSTQDLQLAKDTFEKYNLDRRLYVVDNRQSDYFKQIFKILEILGFEWASRLFHISYGMVKLPEGQMSSRKGLIISADDVYKKLVDLEKAEISNSIKSSEITEETAKRVALAAFRYGMLKIDPKQDITFSFEEATRFDGNTGPYLLYTYARINAILEKIHFEFKKDHYYADLVNYPALSEYDYSVLRLLYRYHEAVLKSAEEYSPNILCNYLYELAQSFNTLYGAVSILNAESEDLKKVRIMTAMSVGQILKNGLQLLGIEVVNRM